MTEERIIVLYVKLLEISSSEKVTENIERKTNLQILMSKSISKFLIHVIGCPEKEKRKSGTDNGWSDCINIKVDFESRNINQR